MSYIEEINKLGSITFDDILSISAQSLSASAKQFPWVGLSHGVKLLENDEELSKYICAYGNMHREKVNLALDAIDNPAQYADKPTTIIDWGCGQGLASVCYFDYMHNLGLVPNVSKIILVEPSLPALQRAQLHLSRYIENEKIVAYNKYINDIQADNINTENGVVLHFFSNILDIPSVNLEALHTTISTGITAEQLFFCVGPQNVGSSRISEFAKLFQIPDSNQVKTYQGKLTGRGTVNLLVFRVDGIETEVIKVAYSHQRNVTVENSSVLQWLLRNVCAKNDPVKNAIQFYQLAIELECFKSATTKDYYCLPIIEDTMSGRLQLNVDIPTESEFARIFERNANPAITKWPKNLNIGIGITFGDKVYRILQNIIPYEDIQQIDITQQYIPVPLSDFLVDAQVADELNLGTEIQQSIELLLKESVSSKDELERILKDAIGNDASLEPQLLVSLTNESLVYSHVKTELRNIIEQSPSVSTLLNDFLMGSISRNQITTVDRETLISVDHMDESQREAIKFAIENRVSVITGPPGTGKTQMILNLVANLMVRGKSVLIASKINKAVDNVKERFDRIDENNYMVRFGAQDILKEQTIPCLDRFITQDLCHDNAVERYEQQVSAYDNACKQITEGEKLLLELASRENDVVILENEVSCISGKIRELENTYIESKRQLDSRYQEIIEYPQACDWSALQVEIKKHYYNLQSRYQGIKRIFFDIFSKKKCAATILASLLCLPESLRSRLEEETGICTVDDVKDGLSLISFCDSALAWINQAVSYTTELQSLRQDIDKKKIGYKRQLAEIQRKQKDNNERIEYLTIHKSNIQDGIEQGKKYIEAIENGRNLMNACISRHLSLLNANRSNVARFRSYFPDNMPWKWEDMRKFREDAREYVDKCRINLVTSLAIKKSFPMEEELFDFVIIDEASQCDIASAIPLLQRAKQFVVIGDPLQLRHISNVNSSEEEAIKEKLMLRDNPRIKYAQWSLYDYCENLIATTNCRRVILDRHYRCHPQIIGYSNDFFYERRLGTRLQVKTIETNPTLREKGIVWVDVKGEQRSDNQNVNEAEATKCIQLAGQLLKENPTIEIGIITPFRHQAQEINALLPEEYRERVVADTVYKFQGAERDVIIYSLVVTDNSPNSKIYWIDYSSPNLVNVAVTRARTALYVVGNKEYIRTHSDRHHPLGYLVEYTEEKAKIVSPYTATAYVIDTNVFIQQPEIIDYINPRDYVIIPLKVIDELDKLKITLPDNSKENAEKALRRINSHKKSNRIRLENTDTRYLPSELSKKNSDNMILAIAIKYRNQNAVILTSDNGLQLKANGLGIKTISYNEFINNL